MSDTAHVTRDDLVGALLPVRGVGQAIAEAVVDAFGGNPDRLVAATESQLIAVDGVGRSTVRAIRRRLQNLESGFHTAVDAIAHEDSRPNIPTDQAARLVDLDGSGDPDLALYPRDPELDPQLVWHGKGGLDSTDLAVPVVPIFIQDKVVPQAIVENLRNTHGGEGREPELTLFDDFDGIDDADAFEFYEHDANWSNRMILGDALVAMTSLAEKEHLKGEVQAIYVDPPYGIKFRSNWQVSTRSRAVSEGRDISRQPEQVRAFRDTWRNGIHSYLTYLRDRLQVAHTLLNDTGSIFVQISDDNLHVVRSLLDEIFGADNFVTIITFQKTMSATSVLLPPVADYILWYARDKSRLKYRQLYKRQELGDEGTANYTHVEEPDGRERSITKGELLGLDPLPDGARAFKNAPTTSSQPRGSGELNEFELKGTKFTPKSGSWKTHETGLRRLELAGRLRLGPTNIYYKRYLDDFGQFPLTNVWTDIVSGFMRDKVYVVQTHAKVVERCLLMSTDPGDLVLDPTCGGGTTAYVAERWGRRWITVDTSRVALALTRARIMGARYPYWLLADTPEGAEVEAAELGREAVAPVDGYGADVRQGFVYRRALHVMLSTIANCEEIQEGMRAAEVESAIRRCAESEVLYDDPYEDRAKVRVAGPFTVESLSPHRQIDAGLTASVPDIDHEARSTAETSGEYDDFGGTVLEHLAAAGVQNGYRDERLKFDTLDPYPGTWVSATGSYIDDGGASHLVAVSLGPEHGTVGRDQVGQAALEAVRVGADLLLVCGFAFDGGATDEATDVTGRDFPVVGEKKMGRVRVLNVRVNADLLMADDLKNTGSGNLFMVFGEPDIHFETTEDGKHLVTLCGVDVYDPIHNEVRSSGPEDAMAWFIDTEYDGNQFFVRHAYFTGDPGQYDPYASLKRALNAEIDHEAWSRLHSTESLPFTTPSTGKIAVKVINHYGDEVLKVFSVP